MTTTELLAFHEQFTKEAREIMAKKNHDYSGASGTTPFANFEVSEQVGVCSVVDGFLVRMLDKFMRINTFSKAGELKTENESAVDACRDVVNYAILLAAYMEDQKKGQP